MDFILSFNNGYANGTPQMIFPVIPNGAISFDRGQNVETFDGINGEMASIGTMNLGSFSIDSIFPNRNYSWMRPGSTSDGWSYVRTIEDVRKQRIPFRAVLLDNAGKEVLNAPVTVESFSYGLDKAGDVAYQISFKEYRFATMEVSSLASSKTEGLEDAYDYSSMINATAGGNLTEAGTAPAIKKYTEADAIALARTMYGEANGLPTVEVACVGWCVCNRVDSSAFKPTTVIGVCAQRGQFDGYKTSYPSSNYYNLAVDVLNRWSREASGEATVGRVLPRDYYYFNGYNGHNWHTRKWHNSPSGYYNDPEKWNYSLPSPY